MDMQSFFGDIFIRFRTVESSFRPPPPTPTPSIGPWANTKLENCNHCRSSALFSFDTVILTKKSTIASRQKYNYVLGQCRH